MGFRLVLTAAIVIGGVIETSTTAPRVVISGAQDSVTGYYADGTIAWEMVTTPVGGVFNFSAGAGTAYAEMRDGTLIVGDNFVHPPTVSASHLIASVGGVLDLQQYGSGGTLHDMTVLPTGTGVSAMAVGAPGTVNWFNPSTAAQTYTYKASWSASNMFHSLGGMGPLQFRIDGEDNLILYGVATAAAGAGTTIFTLPAGYYNPSKTLPGSVDIDSSTHVLSRAPIAIDTAGNVLLGIAAVAGSTYLFECQMPLGNLT